jgi:DNA modification methylase
VNHWRILHGDVRKRLRDLPDGSVQTCVTSPPYWGLRDYGVEGQIGLEQTPEAFVAALVGVFVEVRRVLADDGTVWLNLGDSYAGSGKGPSNEGSKQRTNVGSLVLNHRNPAQFASGQAPTEWLSVPAGLKGKDLVGIPWRVAFALQADGWYLRADIIWSKPNPMPESVTDRPTKAHEYIFLLSKSARYYYDAEAIKEAAVSDGPRGGNLLNDTANGPNGGNERWRGDRKLDWAEKGRNKRSVWTVATWPFSDWTQTSRQVRVSWDESDGDTTRIASPDCPVHGDSAVLAAKALCGGRASGSENGSGYTDVDLFEAPADGFAPTRQTHEPDSTEQSLDSPLQPSAHAAIARSNRTSRTGRAPVTTQPCKPFAGTDAGTADTSTPRASVDSVVRTLASSTAADSVSCGQATTGDETQIHIGGKCSCEYYRTVTEEMSHFATFPEALIEPCILAGSKVGQTVLDPFNGSGTTGAVAIRHQRNYIGIELNAAYVQLARKRIGAVAPLFSEEQSA